MKQWTDSLSDYFKVDLSDEDSCRWWDDLKRTIKDLDNAELCDAIRQASFDDRSKYAGKPCLKDLRIWVYSLRKRQRGPDNPDDDKQEYVNMLRGEIMKAHRAGNHSKIWNIICCPEYVSGVNVNRSTAADECASLESFAESECGFTRPDRSGAIDEIRALCRGVQDGMIDGLDRPKEMEETR